MLRSNLCDYSDAYIFTRGTIAVAEVAAGGGNNSIQVVFKISAPFTNCISEINNNGKFIDIVISMYSLTEYGDNSSKTSGRLYQCYRDEPALDVYGTPANFPGKSALFKFKQTITDSAEDNGTKNVEIMVPFKYLSNFWRILTMPLINCEINLILTWSENFGLSTAAPNQAATFAITDTKRFVSVVTLSIDDITKLLQQLKFELKRTINWNKCNKNNSTECSKTIL